MINISATSNKTYKFESITIDKAAAGIEIGLNNDSIQFDDYGRGKNRMEFKKLGDRQAV